MREMHILCAIIYGVFRAPEVSEALRIIALYTYEHEQE